ncbi:hypothetical protein [Halobacillus litoralis]|uniref:hypothetical protein n=1 Tax=Halobacillus litoralis TaxID=45668 RepID=UPI001CD43C9C|nr:hypothetical protein [Halobacillus litoralis]MCA1021542.1 hypothetical protein [Halobacillus litoralis]
MSFKSQVGKKLYFYGVDNEEFKLGDIVYLAVEDEDDGYRSYLESIEQTEPKGIFFDKPLAEVIIEELDDGYTEGFRIVDAADSHVWLIVGTSNYDDYYPYFVFDYNPKSK